MYLEWGTSEVERPHCMNPGQLMSPSPSSSLLFPPPPSPYFLISLPCHWCGYKEQSWGLEQGSLIGEAQRQVCLATTVNSLIRLWAALSFIWQNYLWGHDGYNQRVADLRLHKYWVTHMPCVYLMFSDNFSVYSAFPSLSMFSTCLYYLCDLCLMSPELHVYT